VGRFTYTDASGAPHLRAWALPLAVAAICLPVVLAMLIGILSVEGTAFGLAAGALAVATLLVIAARARPRGALEVAAHRDHGRRVLVLAAAEATPEAAQRVADHAGDAADVRLVAPLRSRRIDRWLSAEDRARDDAQGMLARSAGALVAAGLPVSGSLGDSDPAQALEDELRAFPADEVIVLARADEDPLAEVAERLELPVTRIAAG
jgi:hypothetical protein